MTVGIIGELPHPLHPLCQILQPRLRVHHDRVQAGVPQERGQPSQVAGIGGQVARGKRVPQRVRAEVLQARGQRVLAQNAQHRAPIP